MHYIIVKTQFEAFHRYKKAPKEVKFLRSFHRHLFKVECTIPVDHSNRQLEFFMIKKKLDGYLTQSFKGKQFELSCEQLAEVLCIYLNWRNIPCTQVEVSEDGENTGGFIK